MTTMVYLPVDPRVVIGELSKRDQLCVTDDGYFVNNQYFTYTIQLLTNLVVFFFIIWSMNMECCYLVQKVS
jgi:hypothetical protein